MIESIIEIMIESVIEIMMESVREIMIERVNRGGLVGGQEWTPAVERDSPEKQQVVGSHKIQKQIQIVKYKYKL